MFKRTKTISVVEIGVKSIVSVRSAMSSPRAQLRGRLNSALPSLMILERAARFLSASKVVHTNYQNMALVYAPLLAILNAVRTKRMKYDNPAYECLGRVGHARSQGKQHESTF